MKRFAIAVLLTGAAFAQSTALDALRINDEGNTKSDAGDYTGAVERYTEAVRIWRSLGESYKAHLAASLMNMGSVLCGAGKRAEGSVAFNEALALHRITLGADHLRTLQNMTLLAADYLMLGELQKAETILEEAMPIARNTYPNDIQLARCLEIESGVLNRHGKLEASANSAEEALRVVLRTTGENSLEAALAYASVAEALRASGRSDRCLPLYRKAHAIYEKFLGPEHPRVASLWSQEGLVEMDSGKLATAEQSMLKAIALLKKGCPDCIVEMSVAQNNLGLLRLKQKRYRDADESLSQAMDLREKFSSTPTPELASSIENLAFARKMLHRNEDAERLSRRAQGMMAAFR